MDKIREVIVVEGLHDCDRVQKAVAADVIVTGGAHIKRQVFDDLARVEKTRGIIILTDPDHEGERIRRTLSARFPNAKHAYLPRKDALKKDDVGVENATREAIQSALAGVRTPLLHSEPEIKWDDLVRAGLVGQRDSAARREQMGVALRIGYANAKTFFKRCQALGVTREEWDRARASMAEADVAKEEFM
ncbi:ribonuclease M5 [Ferroacidibacillus organovorans]|uniref:Ribonuclease M5 n=1 Tax=Ferroacidibacillus organovorans TaxID=1765683 RepID=A0A101XS90_9BACL|nr:ribonuclease M5 [Ferroacidibacillus organovorans]KUO96593.1 hypothetical protein ATW55_00480 [Ferroacidibacillus organovorans]